MKLSAPIYILKQQARVLARNERMPLNQALDRIANREGFGAWSLLAARRREDEPAAKLFSQLSQGVWCCLPAGPVRARRYSAWRL
jgi:hypothetical protein